MNKDELIMLIETVIRDLPEDDLMYLLTYLTSYYEQQ